MIIDDISEMIGGIAICLQQDFIIELGAIKYDFPSDLILNMDLLPRLD
jgi:hypothetical protein